ncbi:MAG: TonB-dependent receptor [Bacteroidota bacterium]
MFRKRLFLVSLALVMCTVVFAQRAVISGIVRDNKRKPIDLVVIADESNAASATAHTNSKGVYLLDVPANKELSLIWYSPFGHEIVRRKVTLEPGETRTIDIVMVMRDNVLVEHVKVANKRVDQTAIKMLDISKAKYMPSTIGGIESIIKLAVGSHNELSSQYNVRGGSFDENLVYVNDFEIYRPFLVRSGQQEGLSFINTDLVSNVNFSVGGFQSKYGDKMSSVLDVSYKRPVTFLGSAMFSLLGGTLHLEGASRNQRFTYLLGARQKSNQYLLQAQPTKGIYNPSFTDVQAMLSYRLSDKWELEGIGNYARNRFTFFPERMTSSFGVLNQAYQLDVFYEGSEFDQFDSRFAGISANYAPDSSKLKIKFLASGFQTNEYETYDKNSAYLFGELQTDMAKKDFGQIKTFLGAGGIHNFARNYLEVNVGDVGMRGSYEAGCNLIQFGANGTHTRISDDLHEWERRDSSAFNQPYDPAALTMAYFYNSAYTFEYTRVSGFVQDNIHFDSIGFSATGGVRANYSELNGELVISPRLQLALKPVHWQRDWLFKLSGGKYAQPPFYREMRDAEGKVNTQLRAQKSYQAVLGTEYNFKMYNRPFKMTVEAYYKHQWDMDPYRFNDVRVRYTAKNNAIGYVYGGEFRLYGDLVEDATSWISVGLMKASQKITDSASLPGYDNYFPLPSDQRFMLGVYFEDYLRRNKNFKAYINMMYATGLPTGYPQGHLYQDLLRLPDYKRVDIGFSALLLDAGRREHPAHSLFNNLKSVWASLEVFNLLSIQNTLSYAWIQDRSTNARYAVPNRLTTRLLNFKIIVSF